jgi:RNA polymerase sigma factor (sigma-70 family)
MSQQGDGTSPSIFPTTQWTALLDPLHGRETQVQGALESLCRIYWKPIYGFVRSRGYDHHNSEEIVQEFVVGLLHGNTLTTVRRDKGRFRAFLLACLRNYLGKRLERENALKRGGGQTAVPWEDVEPTATELSTEDSREFDAAFACRLLEEAMNRLRRESIAMGKLDFFEDLYPHIAGQGTATPRAEIAQKYSLGINAVDVAIHRARKRYGLLLRELVLQVVGSPDEIQEELHYLIRALSHTRS